MKGDRMSGLLIVCFWTSYADFVPTEMRTTVFPKRLIQKDINFAQWRAPSLICEISEYSADRFRISSQRVRIYRN